MKRLNIFFLLLIGLLWSCTDRIGEESESNHEDMISLTASISNDASMRTQFSPIDGTLNLMGKFTDKDDIRIYMVQGSVVKEVAIKPTNITNNGQTCTLAFTIPAEIDKTQEMTLVGYTGIGSNLKRVKIEGGKLSLCVTPYVSSQEAFNPPLRFVIKNFRAQNSGNESMKAQFMHMGAYEVMHLTNKSNAELTRVECRLGDAADYGSANTWAHNRFWDSATNSSSYPWIDLITGEITYTKASGYNSSQAPTIAPGATVNLYSWYIPKENVNVPATVAYIYAGTQRGKSKNTIPAQSFPMRIGFAYHAYATWDGETLDLTDKAGTAKPYPYISFETGIAKGKNITFYTWISYSESKEAYVDLNDNRKKDPLENLQKTLGNNIFTVDNPKITYYGNPISLRIPGQQLSKINISPACTNLVELDVTKNNLSADELNKLFEQLPDISGIEKSTIAPKALSISGNPGVDGCNPTKAAQKGWELDVTFVDNTQPNTYLMMSSYAPEKKLTFALDAAEADRAGVWIDLNGNAIREENESITSFGADHMQTISYTAKDIIIYGNITLLDVKGNGTIMAIEPTASIRYLNCNDNAVLALFLDKCTRLEYLACSGNSFHAKYPLKLNNAPKLRVLDCHNAGLQILDLSTNDALTFINCSGNAIPELTVKHMKGLKTLIASRNQLNTLDVSANLLLKHLEVISNEMSATALDALMVGLKDLSDDAIGGALWIANNPGTGTAKILTAKNKNWEVDTKSLKGGNKIKMPDFNGQEW